MRHFSIAFLFLWMGSFAAAQTEIPIRYQSPLKSYKRIIADPPNEETSKDKKSSTWVKANDTVREVGGWRVYLRQSQSETPQ
jgi:hypothetical protein